MKISPAVVIGTAVAYVTAMAGTAGSVAVAEYSNDVDYGTEIELDGDTDLIELDGDGSVAEVEETEEKNLAEAGVSASVDEKLSVEEITYMQYDRLCYYLVVTNNSDKVVQVEGDAVGLDAEGNEMEHCYISIPVLGPGETGTDSFSIGNTDQLAAINYSLTTDDSYYEPILGDLELQTFTRDDGAIIAYVINHGETDAIGVEVDALFLNENGEVVESDYEILSDVDYRIKAGTSIAGLIGSYEDYADVRLFLNARGDGIAQEPMFTGVSDVEYKTYSIQGGYALFDYVVFKNNTDQNIKVKGNAIAKDADGNMIGAANLYVDMIGPGEESIGDFCFNGVDSADSVEVSYSYAVAEDYYTNVVGDLTAVADKGEDELTISITNTGEKDAEFVEAYVIFFDADNNPIDADYTYVGDDDSQIKAGETQSDSIYFYDDFDHFEIYLTGYANVED